MSDTSDDMEAGAALYERSWLSSGRRVKIFTARAHSPEAVEAIEDWCKVHLGQKLEVTAMKDCQMVELWDDRVIQVERNTGRQLIPAIETKLKRRM